ncbi:Bifunctional dihydrofolate reductase-thymidylate synthase [Trichostrongylus colubriformis]|uniref:Thymidylate synthase n=1 Tax=Trichostrongylus colubriformis TaxID=6319 RepID=A0AAN8IHL4_TRICO
MTAQEMKKTEDGGMVNRDEMKKAGEEVNRDEMKYLDQIREIMTNGKLRTDRTGVGTLSIFGMQSRYNLRGASRAFSSQTRKIEIWDANGSREFLDALGFTDREEGDLGPVYGFQWRHFGAKYRGPDANYDGEGVDQLAEVISLIKNNPDSRRIILSAWNPSDLKIMALPPCHTLCQFYVHEGELSCQLYQRSGDMGLGVPFNIASYALFTHMIAHVCGLKAGDLVHTLGDAHIYTNHIDALKIQLERTPTAFPTIEFGEGINSIDDFTEEKIILKNYSPQKAIKMEMAV